MSRFLKTEAGGGLEFTEELVRVTTGHFDIEIATQINASNVGIRSIDRAVTSQLLSLTTLDLSKNSIVDIKGLVPVGRTLIRLDLSFNSIINIEALHADSPFNKLEVLRLQGNLVRDMQSVIKLSTNCNKLRAIYLREANFKGSNPVCENVEDYSDQMAKHFSPKCRCIDGHYFCHDEVKPKRIDDGDDNEIALPASKAWVSDAFFESAVTEEAGKKFGCKSEEIVKGLIKETKEVLKSKVNV